MSGYLVNYQPSLCNLSEEPFYRSYLDASAGLPKIGGGALAFWQAPNCALFWLAGGPDIFGEDFLFTFSSDKVKPPVAERKK